MSAFTIPLKSVIELTGGDIGLDSYPIFEESYREGLNQKIIDHYWNREIGIENVEMFRFNLRRKMNEIMPYFNQLYESTRFEYDPLTTIDITTVTDGEHHFSGTRQQNIDGTVTGTEERDLTTETTENGTLEAERDGTRDESSRNVQSDFPQVQLSGNTDYATASADATGKVIEHSEDSNQTTNNSQTDETGTRTNTEATDTDIDTTTVNDQENHDVRNVKGYSEYPARLIQSYRAAILNVDMQVIDALSELFMLLWDSSDSYFNRGNYFYGW